MPPAEQSWTSALSRAARGARTVTVYSALILAFFLWPFAALIVWGLLSHGSLSAADRHWLVEGVLGMLAFIAICTVLTVVVYQANQAFENFRAQRAQKARRRLRDRRRQAVSGGFRDPRAERGYALAASLDRVERRRARRFAIRRTRVKLAKRLGMLPVYALLGVSGFAAVWLPLTALLHVPDAIVAAVGFLLGAAIYLYIHLTDSREQTDGDPLLILGQVIRASSGTSEEGLERDAASSNVHSLEMRVRAANSLREDGSFGPAPLGAGEVVTLTSFDDLYDRVGSDERVAFLATPDARVVGLLGDSFPRQWRWSMNRSGRSSKSRPR